jgi:hypothetical protein
VFGRFIPRDHPYPSTRKNLAEAGVSVGRVGLGGLPIGNGPGICNCRQTNRGKSRKGAATDRVHLSPYSIAPAVDA